MSYLIEYDRVLYSYPDSADYFHEKATEYAIKNNDQEMLADCYNYRGIYLEDKSKFSEALIQYNEAYNIALSLNDSVGIAMYANNVAGIYVLWGEYEKSLSMYHTSLSIYNAIDDQEGIAAIYNNLGVLYDYQKDYVTALAFYEKALIIYRKIENEEGVANALNNIGLIYFYNKEYTKARDHYIKSLSYDFERNNKPGIAISFGNIGELYLEMGEIETALQYYEKALALNVEIGNKEGIARVKNQIGTLNTETGKYQEAEKQLKESLSIAEETGTVDLILENLNQLHKLYFQQNKYKIAYIIQSEFHTIQDSIFSVEKRERLNQLQTQYDYEKHLRDIELLKDKSKLTEMQLKQQHLRNQQQRGILYAVIFLVLIVAFFLINSAKNNNKIHQNNMQLLAKNSEIEAAKQELIFAKEKAEESDKLKSSFLANMSHEIRTPMNSILGFSELLAEEHIPTEEKREYINYIKSAGKTLLALINDIIDLAKIEAEQITVNIYPTNLNIMMSELAEYYSELKKIGGKEEIQININTDLTDNKASILTDSERFRQIMTNLLSNALKFTESGSIDFGYKLKDEKLLFYVKDTGIGIKEKNLKIIFDHFRQIDESHTRKFGGTGLGLTICRNLISILGGEIWAESTPGVGSTFFFTLPYNPVKESTHGTENENTNSSLPDLNDKIILVAEDEDSNFLLMKTQLKNSGVTILRAKTGLEAVDIFKLYRERIDLILMDIQMPEMNGYEAMKAIKQQDKNSIIIAQTAHAMAEEQKKIKDSGFDDYMAKPITKTKFNTILKKYLS